MASVGQVDREPSVLLGVLWLAGLLTLYFVLGHLPLGLERWFALWVHPWGAAAPTTACPYPFCGRWVP